jgi:hypothetical protein
MSDLKPLGVSLGIIIVFFVGVMILGVVYSGILTWPAQGS